MQTDLVVTDFEICGFRNQFIKIFINHAKDSSFVEEERLIYKPLFEMFLKTNDKLNWELNYSEAGEHEQKTGTMNIDEYWESGMSYITEDLLEYYSLTNKK
jgi:hypothetical protein